MFDTQFREIVHQITESAAQSILREIRAEQIDSQGFKLIYSEVDAAEFLGMSKAQLQKYRKEEMINFICYPIPKQFAEVIDDNRRNCLYSYTLSALLDFALKFERIVQPRTLKLASHFLEKEGKRK